MFNYLKRKRAVKAYQQALVWHQTQFAHSTPLTLVEEGESLLNILRLYFECLRLGVQP